MRKKRWDFGDYYDWSQNTSDWMDYSHDQIDNRPLSSAEIIFYAKVGAIVAAVLLICCCCVCFVICGPLAKGCGNCGKLCNLCCNACKDACCCYDPSYRLLKEGAEEMGLEMPPYDDYALWRDSIRHGTKEMIKEEIENDPKAFFTAFASK